METTGALFLAPRRADVEIARFDLQTRPKDADTIYHYTTSEALLGILQSRELWLSDYAYLNDYREIAHGLGLARRAIEIANQRSTHDGKAVLSRLAKELDDLRPLRICMSSFSLDSDSLPQWRAYGGLAIGMSVSELGRWYTPDCTLDAVTYDEEKQLAMLEIVIHEYLEAMHLDLELKKPHPPAVIALILASELIRRLAFFKNSAFREEHEVRYCFIEDTRIKEHLGVPLIPIRHRARQSLIIPYLGTRDLIWQPRWEKQRKEPGRVPIVEVVVGPQPHADLVENGVRDALIAGGYKDVHIRRSEVPFRSLGPPAT